MSTLGHAVIKWGNASHHPIADYIHIQSCPIPKKFLAPFLKKMSLPICYVLIQQD